MFLTRHRLKQEQELARAQKVAEELRLARLRAEQVQEEARSADLARAREFVEACAKKGSK